MLLRKLALPALIAFTASFSACDLSSCEEALNELPFINSTQTEATTTATVTETETEAETTTSETKEYTDEAGGNPEENYIEITVSGDKFIYDNGEVTIERLLEIFDGLDKTTSVKITDDNASLNAYQQVTDALDEREIAYIKS